MRDNALVLPILHVASAFQFVGLPDKFDTKSSNRLKIPPKIHGISPRTITLGTDATPNVKTLKPLFLLLFGLIFKASKA